MLVVSTCNELISNRPRACVGEVCVPRDERTSNVSNMRVFSQSLTLLPVQARIINDAHTPVGSRTDLSHRSIIASINLLSSEPKTRTSSRNLGIWTRPFESFKLASSRTISTRGSDTPPPCIPECKSGWSEVIYFCESSARWPERSGGGDSRQLLRESLLVIRR